MSKQGYVFRNRLNALLSMVPPGILIFCNQDDMEDFLSKNGRKSFSISVRQAPENPKDEQQFYRDVASISFFAPGEGHGDGLGSGRVISEVQLSVRTGPPREMQRILKHLQWVLQRVDGLTGLKVR